VTDRILFYCQHVLGIGHLVRSTEIAKERSRGSSVLLICGVEKPEGFQFPRHENTEILQLPPQKTDPDFSSLHSSASSQSTEEVKALRRTGYIGYVCSPEPVKSREQVRADLRLKRQNLIVVTTGGGHDGYPLMRPCLEAFHRIGKYSRFEAVLITGPLMDADQREQLRAQVGGWDARVLTCVEDASAFINAAEAFAPNMPLQDAWHE